jgi:hypothetical protein
VVAPEMPGGRPVRYPVLRHQAYGQRDDPVCVVAPRRGQVGQVGHEAAPAAVTAVLGVDDAQVEWPATAQVTEVVQGVPARVVAIGGSSTAGAATVAEIARPALHSWRWEILHPGDALGGVGEILTRWHTRSSGAQSSYPRRPDRTRKREMNSPSLLQTRIIDPILGGCHNRAGSAFVGAIRR